MSDVTGSWVGYKFPQEIKVAPTMGAQILSGAVFGGKLGIAIASYSVCMATFLSPFFDALQNVESPVKLYFMVAAGGTVIGAIGGGIKGAAERVFG